MSREILLLADAISREKGVAIDSVIKALEGALAVVTRKQIAPEANIVITIDRDSGEQTAERLWTIVADGTVETADNQLSVSDAKTKFSELGELSIGDVVSETVEHVTLGRIGATTAKQIIMQKLREAEREALVAEFVERGEKVIYGTVKQVNRGGYNVEIGRLQAFLPKEQLLPRENIRLGDKVRAGVLRIEKTNEGPRVILSRTCNEFVQGLFENEVPEIGDGDVEIKAIARDPGVRCKIAVRSLNSKQDPVGSFVGMRGMRVQNVINEIGGERIDVIRWDEDLAQFALSALAPAEVSSIIIDEESHSIDVVVNAENLPLAIGRGGQNVRLASALLGWELNIVSDEDARRRSEIERETAVSTFITKLDVDEELAGVLADEGFSSIEEIAYVPVAELLAIDGFDGELVDALRQRAREYLSNEALVVEEKIEDVHASVANLKGMTKLYAVRLFEAGIKTRDDVADLATDEFVEFTGATAEEASVIIMDARSHWAD